jgi:sporulation protein YlmC with PRC-barrel domain
MTRKHNSSRKSPGGVSSLGEAWYGPVSRLPGAVRQHHWQIASSFAAIIVMLGLLFVVVDPKPALSQGVHLVKVDVSVVGHAYRASKLIGANVVNEKNESVGKIDDIIIDKNNVMFAVLQVGGFLGVGSRLVAVPYDSLKIAEGGKRIELPGASKDELNKLTEFKYLG